MQFLSKLLPTDPAPVADTPDGRPPHKKLLSLDLHPGTPGRDCSRLLVVSVVQCKPCGNPDVTDDLLLSNLPADLITYVLNPFAATSPLYHVTLDGISPPPPPEKTRGRNRSQASLPIRGRGGAIAAMHEPDWVELGRRSWARPASSKYLPLPCTGFPLPPQQHGRRRRKPLPARRERGALRLIPPQRHTETWARELDLRHTSKGPGDFLWGFLS